jgi:arginyl-tRNA synthetase
MRTCVWHQVVKLQSGDADNLAAWQLFCDISRAEFQKLYTRLDVELLERGESFYNPVWKRIDAYAQCSC